jgi:WD40 repeat protein
MNDTSKGRAHKVDFTSDGQWLAIGGMVSAQLLPRNGGAPVLVAGYPTTAFPFIHLKFTQRGDRLVTAKEGEIRIYSAPGGKELAIRNIEPLYTRLFMGSHSHYTVSEVESGVVVRQWPLDGGEPSVVGRMDLEGVGKAIWGKYAVGIDPSGKWFAYGRDRQIYLRSLEDWSMPPRLIGEHSETIDVGGIDFHAGSGRIATRDVSGEIRIWSTEVASGEPVRVLQGGVGDGPLFDGSGNRLVDYGEPEGRATVKLWHLDAPLEAEPLVMLRGQGFVNGAAFDPSGRWLATGNSDGVAFWPLTRDYPLVLRGHQGWIWNVVFTPDGKQVASASVDGTVRLWFLEGDKPSRVLLRSEDLVYPEIDIDPSGEKLLVSGHRGRVFIVPLGGGSPRALQGFSSASAVGPVAFGPHGRLAAAAPLRGPKEEKVIRIWDLESGESRVLGPVEGAGDFYEGRFFSIHFLPDGRLLSCGVNGVHLWDLEHHTMNRLESGIFMCGLSRDGHQLLVNEAIDREHFRLKWMDLVEGQSRLLREDAVAYREIFDPTGTLAVGGGENGMVRVGPLTGEEPHLLLGHKGSVFAIAVSPDGRWIASGGYDTNVRLWPMPDMDEPPFHTLPYEELLARLRTVTNVRVVEDDGSSTGYRIDYAPFPGWETVPMWWRGNERKDRR